MYDGRNIIGTSSAINPLYITLDLEMGLGFLLH